MAWKGVGQWRRLESSYAVLFDMDIALLRVEVGLLDWLNAPYVYHKHTKVDPDMQAGS